MGGTKQQPTTPVPRPGNPQQSVTVPDTKPDPSQASPYNAADVPNLGAAREPPFKNPSTSNQAKPAFDILGERLFRGYLAEYLPYKRASERYRLNFHFNPEIVTEEWDIDTSMNNPYLQDTASMTGGLRTQGVSLGVKLRFDRVNDTRRVRDGVLADMRILAKVLTGGVGGANTDTNALYGSPVHLALGRTAASVRHHGQQPALRTPLGCIGFIVNAAVNYTRFNRDMTPVRCEVDMSVRVHYWLPSDATVNSGEGGAGSVIPRDANGNPANSRGFQHPTPSQPG